MGGLSRRSSRVTTGWESASSDFECFGHSRLAGGWAGADVDGHRQLVPDRWPANHGRVAGPKEPHAGACGGFRMLDLLDPPQGCAVR